MACGDRYRALVVTTSGLNLDNPTGLIPSIDDVLEWRELARKLGLYASAAIDALALLGPPWDAWNAANEQRNRGVDLYAEVPMYVTLAPTDDVGTAQAAIAAYLCALELAEDAMVARGSTPPPVPGVAPTPDPGLPSFGGIATVAIVVGGGVLLWKVTRR